MGANNVEEEGRVLYHIRFIECGVWDRKLKNADSECLASYLLRRTYIATKVAGELLRSFDPTVSEWGNPSSFAGNSEVKILT